MLTSRSLGGHELGEWGGAWWAISLRKSVDVPIFGKIARQTYRTQKNNLMVKFADNRWQITSYWMISHSLNPPPPTHPRRKKRRLVLCFHPPAPFRVKSVADLQIFEPPGSGSVSTRYGSGSGIRVRIILSSCKNSKKNVDFHCLVTSLWLFIFEKLCKSSLKK